MSTNPILSIAIPTYNRAEYLDLCLKQIYRQIGCDDTRLEVIVSNNASIDHTDQIVKEYSNKAGNFHYIKNKTNIGPDRNIAQCFLKARGKYVVVFGDDELFLDGALEKVITILESGEYGIVHLSVYGYTNDYITEKPRQKKGTKHTVFDSSERFIDRVNYKFTFISSNIINKSILPNDFTIDDFFFQSNLVQLSWTFNALFKSRQNVLVHEYLITGKAENTGNIGICSVFGINFNRIFDYYIGRGIDSKYFSLVAKKLLKYFFPDYIYKVRNNYGTYLQEDYYSMLKPVYRKYLYFWIFTAPVIKLPVIIARLIFYITVILKKFEYGEASELPGKIVSTLLRNR